MKILTLRFRHPVYGQAKFFRTGNGHLGKKIKVTSDKNNEVKISLKDLAVGAYRLIFEWEHDGKSFSINRDVVIQA